MRHRAERELEDELGPLLFRLFLFVNACALVLFALSSEDRPPGDALLLPVQGVGISEVTDSFSDRRGVVRQHGALDIMAPWGTPVVASVDGVIHRLAESPRGGIGIYQMDTAARRCYYYGHLARYAFGLEEGMRVSRGDVVGFVGATGNASEDAPHLHFAAYDVGSDGKCFGGTPLNPYTLLVAD